MDEFLFKGCIEIKELLGLKADDEQQLMELIEEVPADCIYYHMHSYFLRHYYITDPYPNDFANWVAIQVRDRVLGEKLATITPRGDKSIEDVRAETIELIDHHLSSLKTPPFVMYGQPFYFMKSRIIEVSSEISVSDFNGFKKALKTVDASAIYNHIFEARFRLKKGRSDFSIWLENVLGMKDLSEKIEMLDSYMYSLEGLRKKLLELCEEA